MNLIRRTTTGLAATLAGGAVLASSLPGLAAPVPALTPAASARPAGGWSAAVIGRTGAAGQLTLVAPDGKQYRIASVGAAWSVADLSNDGRKVLLVNPTTNWPSHQVVDVRTGGVTKVAGNYWEMRFAAASTALLGRTAARNANGTLVRTSLAGAVQVRHAGTTGGSAMLPSADGKLVVSRTSARRLQVNTAGGALVRGLATPRGASWCEPTHWVTTTKFTARCAMTRSAQETQVYLFSTAGGTATPLTSRLPRTGGTFMFGYADSWGTPKGQLVEVPSGCGPSRLGLVRYTRVSLLSAGVGAMPQSVQGSNVWFLNRASACGNGTGTLSRHDLATGRTVLLAGGTRNPGLRTTSASVLDRTE